LQVSAYVAARNRGLIILANKEATGAFVLKGTGASVALYWHDCFRSKKKIPLQTVPTEMVTSKKDIDAQYIKC